MVKSYINIEGDSFEAQGNAGMLSTTKENITVTGGIFNKAISDSNVRVGYTVENTNDKWSVIPTANVNSEGKLISGTYATNPSAYVAEGYIVEGSAGIAPNYERSTSWTVGKISYKVEIITENYMSLPDYAGSNLTDQYNAYKEAGPEKVYYATNSSGPYTKCTESNSTAYNAYNNAIGTKYNSKAFKVYKTNLYIYTSSADTAYFVNPEAANAYQTENGGTIYSNATGEWVEDTQ